MVHVSRRLGNRPLLTPSAQGSDPFRSIWSSWECSVSRTILRRISSGRLKVSGAVIVGSLVGGGADPPHPPPLSPRAQARGYRGSGEKEGGEESGVPPPSYLSPPLPSVGEGVGG